MKNDRKIDTKYVDVLDGVRAISIIIVMIFHFWQQTWRGLDFMETICTQESRKDIAKLFVLRNHLIYLFACAWQL